MTAFQHILNKQSQQGISPVGQSAYTYNSALNIRFKFHAICYLGQSLKENFWAFKKALFLSINWSTKLLWFFSPNTIKLKLPSPRQQNKANHASNKPIHSSVKLYSLGVSKRFTCYQDYWLSCVGRGITPRLLLGRFALILVLLPIYIKFSV